MDVRPLTVLDAPAMRYINEQGLPGTGRVSVEEMADLLTLCELALGVYREERLLGFVLCLLPQTRYGSLNYAWFNQRYDAFLYVDRIAVASDQRNNQIGSNLYHLVIAHANSLNLPVTAEVSSNPPNPGSMRFHARHQFIKTGEIDHGDSSVTMMIRPMDAGGFDSIHRD